MELIESARPIRFGDEIIVEVQGTDENGVIDVISYQFAFDGVGRALTPRDSVDEEHVSIIHDALEEEGFYWSTETG